VDKIRGGAFCTSGGMRGGGPIHSQGGERLIKEFGDTHLLIRRRGPL